jgi:biotin operon repressor
MEIFHIWDLERVNIKLKKEFLTKLNLLIKDKFFSKNKAYEFFFKDKEIPFATFKNVLKESTMKNSFVSLEIFLNICKKLEISEEELEKNILFYKTAGGVNFIQEPILPIKINPVFDMILAHNIGDGTVINPGNGRLPYFGYRQFDEFYRIAYVRKIEEIFGKINFKEKDYFLKSTRPYCPPVLSTLFFKYYSLNIKDFLSDTARIPEIIFENNERMLSVLIAFIIDEGNIDSTQIVVHLKNKLLIEDLNKICGLLGYSSTISENRIESSHNYWRLNILRKGMEKLWIDYLELNKKYPLIDLGWKGEKISNSFKIYNRANYKTGGNKDSIIKLLGKESLSVNQIAERLNMTRQGARYHMHNLINEGKIKLINKEELNWRYKL